MRPPLERALSLDPELTEIHNSLGAMHENLGDLKLAEVWSLSYDQNRGERTNINCNHLDARK